MCICFSIRPFFTRFLFLFFFFYENSVCSNKQMRRSPSVSPGPACTVCLCLDIHEEHTHLKGPWLASQGSKPVVFDSEHPAPDGHREAPCRTTCSKKSAEKPLGCSPGLHGCATWLCNHCHSWAGGDDECCVRPPTA